MTARTIHIIKTLDEVRSNPALGYQDDAELTLALAASTPYWIEIGICIHQYKNFASNAYILPVYTGTLDASLPHSITMNRCHTYYNTAYDTAPGFTHGDFSTDSANPFDPAVVQNNTSSNAATVLGMAWWSGRLNTTSSGNLKIQWQHVDNGFAGGSTPTTIKAGSWMYATPLNICTF